MQGGMGGCKSPARMSGELEAPQEQQGVWGVAAPKQKQFCGPRTTFRPPSTDHLFITIFREKVKPITLPPDKVFVRPG